MLPVSRTLEVESQAIPAERFRLIALDLHASICERGNFNMAAATDPSELTLFAALPCLRCASSCTLVLRLRANLCELDVSVHTALNPVKAERSVGVREDRWSERKMNSVRLRKLR